MVEARRQTSGILRNCKRSEREASDKFPLPRGVVNRTRRPDSGRRAMQIRVSDTLCKRGSCPASAAFAGKSTQNSGETFNISGSNPTPSPRAVVDSCKPSPRCKVILAITRRLPRFLIEAFLARWAANHEAIDSVEQLHLTLIKRELGIPRVWLSKLRPPACFPEAMPKPQRGKQSLKTRSKPVFLQKYLRRDCAYDN